MKKTGIIILSALCCIMLFGCGAENKPDTTVVSIDKNGKVVADLVEDFDKDYYDLNELESDIKSDISDYNTVAGTEQIKLEQMSVEEQKAYARISYLNCKSYETFNDCVFFLGTIAEAESAGYDMKNVVWNDAEGKAATFDKGQIQDELVIIFEEPVHIRVPQNIQYISDNVTLVNKKEAAANIEEGQFAYILYK